MPLHPFDEDMLPVGRRDMRHVFAAVLHGAAIVARDTRCGDALIGAAEPLLKIGTP